MLDTKQRIRDKQIGENVELSVRKTFLFLLRILIQEKTKTRLDIGKRQYKGRPKIAVPEEIGNRNTKVAIKNLKPPPPTGAAHQSSSSKT